MFRYNEFFRFYQTSTSLTSSAFIYKRSSPLLQAIAVKAKSNYIYCFTVVLLQNINIIKYLIQVLVTVRVITLL